MEVGTKRYGFGGLTSKLPIANRILEESVKVIGSVFKGRDRIGDFGWMIQQPEFQDALFIFNDNEEQFLEHQRNPNSAFGCAPGGGNAVIRPYQCQSSPPRASGIPTGKQGSGYSNLTPEVQQVINLAIQGIVKLLETGRYQRAFYSAANDQGELGTGIFQVSSDVKDYITQQLKSLNGGLDNELIRNP